MANARMRTVVAAGKLDLEPSGFSGGLACYSALYKGSSLPDTRRAGMVCRFAGLQVCRSAGLQKSHV